MRYSRYFLPTLKETPSDAELISHQLMLRAGLIRKLASGLYTFLPAGFKVLKKIEDIVRREMNKRGAQEIMMPIVQPAELWQESGRWDKYGKELLRFKDRHDRDFCLGPTHEEVVTDLIRREVRSYRDLPLNLYQIHTKFRDEIRPRFGVMRAREFVMKDAYSFHADSLCLEKTYEDMYACYTDIFSACGLNFRAVEAHTGAIGGDKSHEFMVLADSGEDQIAVCSLCSYAANVELAEVNYFEDLIKSDPSEEKPREKVLTPDKRTIIDVCEFLGLPTDKSIKTLMYKANDRIVMVLVRGDHQLNEVKLAKFLGVEEVSMCDEDTVKRLLNAPFGFLGPVGVSGDIEIIADYATKHLKNFVVGANEEDYHYVNVNWDRDVPKPKFADLRFITENDKCPKCGSPISIKRGIEVGHIFKLGTKYSKALNATFLDKDGKSNPIIMGCYGIGVSRIIGAAIEQNHDERGIIFPPSIAPFQVIVTPTDIKNNEIMTASEAIYNELLNKGVDVIIDDRDERPGVKFKDSELLGIPFRVTVGKKFKENSEVELYSRKENETICIHHSEVIEKIAAKINI